MSRLKKSRTQNYINPQRRELPLGKCHAYLVGIGIDWMVANTVIGKYSLDDIRAGVLLMRENNVNVMRRQKFLLDHLEKKL